MRVRGHARHALLHLISRVNGCLTPFFSHDVKRERFIGSSQDGVLPESIQRRVEPFEAGDAARVRYLSVDECKRLINAPQGSSRALDR